MEDFYCKEIISGNTKVDVIYETNLVMAFYHTDPYFEQHAVIIPKQHIESISHYPNHPDLNKEIFETIIFVTKLFENKFGACRISSNVGQYQSTKHLHWYVHYGNRIRTESGEKVVE